ncbi:ubiquinone biosynthesis protein COQ4 [Porphyrobacter sp. GA68]|uniref:ubiquinone biosynthesis protein COQ4 n=1 Tax=Porphyrobacter sp. GA68 TaxID=2883480 RepID=UPI001D18C2F5|nr:ubiquinone biosynthesis protein COQ4 [Porphyrobacter sp. GA68]
MNDLSRSVPEALECASDGTILRDPRRTPPRYSLPRAVHHFRELLKDKEETSHVFHIFDALPSQTFMPRVSRLGLSPHGEALRRSEPSLPPLLDDHAALRRTPPGSVGHAYCDFMEREGLTAAGLVAEAEKLNRPKFDDLVQWYADRSRDVHDLMHVLTGYGRDPLGEQCVLLFTHGQQPSQGHLLIGWAGAAHIKRITRSSAPVFKAALQAQRTGKACPPLTWLPIRDMLELDLREVRTMLGIPDPTWYQRCHAVWRSEGIDPYKLIAPEKDQNRLMA